MNYVAWDIETCPLPIEQFSAPQQRRYEIELSRQERYDHERSIARTPEDRSRLVRSVHPMLGWICCISAVRAPDLTTHQAPRSWTASELGEENSLLMQFWEDLAAFRNKLRNITWITFNGKRFDAPFLLCRSTHYRLDPSRFDILNTYPYRHSPHTDLATLWPHTCSLNDLCDHLSIPSPKTDLDGSSVAQAIAEGRIKDVEHYCAGDVIATLKCFQAMPCILQL